MRITSSGRLFVAAALLVAGPTILAAQIDYRNLDDDRPTRVEDAYPAERYAFEFIIPYAVERERGGAWIHASPIELEYGVFRNAHVGVKAPVAGVRDAGTTEWGLSGIRAFGPLQLQHREPAPTGGLAPD
jgi:hypothetical protein